MKVYVEAYDKNDMQILGNLDGQGVINAKQYKRTAWYKSLRTYRTLNGVVDYYKIVTEQGKVLEQVNNTTTNYF